jgi:hypothetical protein
LLPHLPRGQALWKVGARSFLVEHRLSRPEIEVVDTDARMASESGPFVPRLTGPVRPPPCPHTATAGTD